MLEVGRTTVMDRVERQLSAFARASQNMAVMAALLDALSAPSTDGVGKMVPAAKEHPQHYYRAASGEFPVALGRAPLPVPRVGAESRPRGSGHGNDFLAGRSFNLQLLEPTDCSVGTSGVPTASPRR
jgi:hypothetical protein